MNNNDYKADRYPKQLQLNEAERKQYQNQIKSLELMIRSSNDASYRRKKAAELGDLKYRLEQ